MTMGTAWRPRRWIPSDHPSLQSPNQERDMTMVLGTWVPIPGNNPHNEICHTFVYRWLIGRGLITGNYPDPLRELNTFTAPPILWPSPGGAARVNGGITVTPGQIVGFWNGHQLVHSMIAVTPTSWIGANNAGCFGVATGRVQIADVNGGFPGALLPNPALRMGWVGNGNQWRAMGCSP
jgi:hypothetical protein